MIASEIPLLSVRWWWEVGAELAQYGEAGSHARRRKTLSTERHPVQGWHLEAGNGRPHMSNPFSGILNLLNAISGHVPTALYWFLAGIIFILFYPYFVLSALSNDIVDAMEGRGGFPVFGSMWFLVKYTIPYVVVVFIYNQIFGDRNSPLVTRVFVVIWVHLILPWQLAWWAFMAVWSILWPVSRAGGEIAYVLLTRREVTIEQIRDDRETRRPEPPGAAPVEARPPPSRTIEDLLRREFDD